MLALFDIFSKFQLQLPWALPIARGYSEYTERTPRQVRDRQTVGVFTPQAAILFILTGAGLLYYFQKEKERMQEEKRKAAAPKKIGRAHVGGPFSLVTQTGAPFSDKDLLGKWSLIYFGFTNCPDICPDELDKMGLVVNEVRKRHSKPNASGQSVDVLPIFVSVDPARDDVPVMKTYISGERLIFAIQVTYDTRFLIPLFQTSTPQS